MHKIYSSLKGIKTYNDVIIGLFHFDISDFHYNEIDSFGFGFYGFVDGGGANGYTESFGGWQEPTFDSMFIACGKDDLDK